jgi:tetratricopeptide (TPR) repeat protein
LAGKKLTPVAGVQLTQFKVVENNERDEDRLEQEALQSAAVERDLSLGDLMRQRSRFDGSVYYYDRAARGARMHPSCSINYPCFARGPTTPEAVPHLQHALEVYPDYSTSHTTLGDAYRLLGEPAKARQHYEHAIQINPLIRCRIGIWQNCTGRQAIAKAAQREVSVAKRLSRSDGQLLTSRTA